MLQLKRSVIYYCQVTPLVISKMLKKMLLKNLIVGVDEAGRGPLVGPVVAAAVILPVDFTPEMLPGLTDSKKLTSGKRESLELLIKRHALAWSVSVVSAAKIDEINILQATMLAMQQAVLTLPINSAQILKVLIDGNKAPNLDYNVITIVKGDLSEPCISAASILAKVHRDKLLHALDKVYPQYGFAKHKGYPTKDHLQAIEDYGIIAEHRKSYGPVKKALLLSN
jgi:ribonuclease HII